MGAMLALKRLPTGMLSVAIAAVVGAIAGHTAALAQVGWPSAKYAPMSLNARPIIIEPDRLKAIRVTAEWIEYLYYDVNLGRQSIVHVPISRAIIGTI